MAGLCTALLAVAIGIPSPQEPRGWVDAELQAGRSAVGLASSELADPAVRLRRLHLVLTGLPPTREQVEAFALDPSPRAWAAQVDSLLETTAHAERFARHFMDWVRYAETHGSEGDPAVPHAWRYRDYLIRAVRDDVPYDQLVREHIAGDLLAEPRVDRERGVVESRLGVAQLRMVQHGFAPTDALEERVRFVDNQIDVLTKAFLGLTVSCARCHDHKFDPITQDEYQSLYACFASARPILQTIDVDADLTAHDAELGKLHEEIRQGLTAAWRSIDDDTLARRLLAAAEGEDPGSASPLRPLWDAVRSDDVVAAHARARAAFEASRGRLAARTGFEDLSKFARTHPGAEMLRPGGFHVEASGPRVLRDILPAGIYSHRLTSKRAAHASSPFFVFGEPALRMRVTGEGGAMARYVVDGYPRGGTVYPLHRMRGGAAPSWVGWDVSYWQGERGYVEVSTAADQAVEVDTGADRSWFGITDVWRGPAGDAPRDELAEHAAPLFRDGGDPEDLGALIDRYARALRAALAAFGAGSIDDDGARFLGAMVRAGVLPTELTDLPGLVALVESYREIEARVPVPRRAPGLLDAEVTVQPRMKRGNHRDLGEPIAPGFLRAVQGEPYPTDASVRLRLAEDFARPDNPWTARVLVNRIWHHVFGRGLVATTDNFGELGDGCSHPQLLDALAADFMASGWSIRHLLRQLCTSRAFQQDSRAGADALRGDSDNRLLTRFGARRLEAEVIRDAMLAVSGRLDRTEFGPSVAGETPRRSVYVRVRRNDLDPLLRTFDFPEPHSTRGRRDVTNVPAQALALSNDRFVIDCARSFAELARAAAGDDEDAMARFLIERAFTRPARREEVEGAIELVADLDTEAQQLKATLAALDAEIESVEAAVTLLRGPVQERLARALAQGVAAARMAAPTPVQAVRFEGDTVELQGPGAVTLRGSARVADGALVLDGGGHAELGGPAVPLRAKTLAAHVVVDDLGHRGGGVIAIETPGGEVFDALVLGEKDEGQWLPGSNFFHRTQALGGPRERQGVPVHVALCYDADGTIRAYRDGQPYGDAYRSEGPVAFAADAATVLLGLRHSPAADGKRFRGRIFSATVHDRALGPAEVEALAAVARTQPLPSEVDAALSEADRAVLDDLRARLRNLTETRAGLAAGVDSNWSRDDAWRAVAQGILSSKEFLFLR
ncbi:MAG: hypothetical protein RL562_1088 [Planctomycetota bacterium]